MKKNITSNTLSNLKVNSKEQFQTTFEMFFDITEFDAETTAILADYIEAYKAEFPDVDPTTECDINIRVNFDGGIKTDIATYSETLFISQKDDDILMQTQRQYTIKSLVLDDLDGELAREATINVFGAVQGIVADK